MKRPGYTFCWREDPPGWSVRQIHDRAGPGGEEIAFVPASGHGQDTWDWWEASIEIERMVLDLKIPGRRRELSLRRLGLR